LRRSRFGLTLIHLNGIPVTNLSVNPARSTGTALLVGGVPLTQFWLFGLASIIGAALGTLIYRSFSKETTFHLVCGGGRFESSFKF